MVIVVVDPGHENDPIFRNHPEDWCFITAPESNESEIWAHEPSVIVLAQRKAILMCRSLYATAAEHYCRLLVLLSPEYGDHAVNARLAGADSCLVGPLEARFLRHAVGNELAAVRRRREAEALILAKTRINDRYELRKLLGLSLRATVYLALDQTTGSEVTVKVLRQMLNDHPQLLKEFYTEARNLKNISADAVVALQEISVWENQPILVFHFGEARNLYAVMREKTLPELEILRIASAVVRALTALKAGGMLHCDIKPENILYRNGQYYLSGFGVLRPTGAPQDNYKCPFWADAAFVSPEFFDPEAGLTARSDIYSLGMVLFMLTQRRNPFAGYLYTVSAARRGSPELLQLTAEEPPIGITLRTMIQAMTLERVEARPRLRELEIIFYHNLTLLTGSFPPQPLSMTAAGTARTAEPTPMPTPPARQSTPTGKLVRHRERRQSDAENRPAPGNARAARMAVRPERRYLPQSRRDRLLLAATALLLLSLGITVATRVFRREPAEFRQGTLMMFTCYSNHTHADRTLNFATIRCQTCGEATTPSRSCRSCKKVFGTTPWPRRAMSEDECATFEQKLGVCPYCRSANVRPTPLKTD